MRKQFAEVKKISEQQKATAATHLQKMVEEFGELGQAINKLDGLKSWKKKDTLENIKENILEEIADNIQILFGIASVYEFSYGDVQMKLSEKNEQYFEWMEEQKKKLGKR